MLFLTIIAIGISPALARRTERLKAGFSVDGCTVYATPLKAYETGQEYRLFITDRVTSTSGLQLSIPVMMPFVIIDENAKIRCVSSHYSSGLTMVTVNTSPDVHTVNIGSDEMIFEGSNTFTYLLQGGSCFTSFLSGAGKTIPTALNGGL